MILIPVTVVCSECERYLQLSIDECVDQAVLIANGEMQQHQLIQVQS